MPDAVKEVQKKEAELQTGVERTRATKVYTPSVDIIERKEDIVVIADMPGVDDKAVDITLEKNVLTIYGRVEPRIPENHRLVVSEYSVGDYQRVFTLSDQINREEIRASVRNGVLRVMLPKAETVKTKKIEVTSEA
jgi:HSP20 family protein